MRSLIPILILLSVIAFGAIIAGCAGTQGPITPTPTPTVVGTPDLSNQNSPEVATFTTYPSLTKLHTPDMAVGLKFITGGFTAPVMIADPHDGSGRLFLVDQTGT